MKKDSPRNCKTNCFLLAPIVFRTPTSNERFPAIAVERFMKLKQAIIKINIATIEKI